MNSISNSTNFAGPTLVPLVHLALDTLTPSTSLDMQILGSCSRSWPRVGLIPEPEIYADAHGNSVG